MSASKGFIGVSSGQFAIRPLEPKTVVPKIERSPLTGQWLSQQQEWRFTLDSPHQAVEIQAIANSLEMKLLPEARFVVGLQIGEPVLTPGIDLRSSQLPPYWLTKATRQHVIDEAHKRCSCCGRADYSNPQIVAKWHFDAEAKKQSLEALNAFCEDCTPIAGGKVPSRGTRAGQKSVQHFGKVNAIGFPAAAKVIARAEAVFAVIRTTAWTIDQQSVQDVLAQHTPAAELGL